MSFRLEEPQAIITPQFNIDQMLQREIRENQPLAQQFSELQILQTDESQRRLRHVEEIMAQRKFQPKQWVEIEQLYQCLSHLLNRAFPHEILNLIQQEAPRFVGNRMSIEDFTKTWVLTEFSLGVRIKKFKDDVIQYHEQLKTLKQQKQQLLNARKNKRDFSQQLNEFGIDTDSSVQIVVVECYGMPKAEYSIQVRVAEKLEETERSVQTNNPQWNVTFKFPVWSPHSHIIITLQQCYQGSETVEIGSLQLPLNLFKDQLEVTEDYVLEESSGVLGDPRRRMRLRVQWTHNRLALVEDNIARMVARQKEIELLNDRVKTMEQQLKIMIETFNESKLIVPVSITTTTPATPANKPRAYGPDACQRFFLDHCHYITTCFKFENNGVQTWQELVFLSSLIVAALGIIIQLSRPYFIQYTFVLIIGALIWAHKEDYGHTVGFKRQLSFFLLISLITDLIWLHKNITEWMGGPQADDLQRQVVGTNLINLLGIGGTIINECLMVLYVLFSYILTLKYEFPQYVPPN